jgi:glutamate 5-kinase
VSQLLLTNDIFQDRKRFLNVKTTLLELLKMGIIPIINENDTVSIDEIMFGDNDILASKVSSMISADSLILLTDTDGLFNQNPKDNSSAKLINTISEDKFDRRVLKDSKKNISFGGMTSKIDAALNVSKYGIPTIIANGMKTKIIDKIFKYENVGTMIIPNIRTIKSRKQWIGMGLKTAGKLLLDDGAIEAIISKGKSLLPSGIKSVEGRFVKGQQVECVSISTGQSIARGLTSYSSDELERIKGKKSNQIVSILGYKYSDEVINRDNMIVDKIK